MFLKLFRSSKLKSNAENAVTKCAPKLLIRNQEEYFRVEHFVLNLRSKMAFLTLTQWKNQVLVRKKKFRIVQKKISTTSSKTYIQVLVKTRKATSLP